MSDERHTSAATDETDSSDGVEPGGGPRRVVSERSVDDVLDALETSESASTGPSDRTDRTGGETEPDDDAVGVQRDGDDGTDGTDGTDGPAGLDSTTPARERHRTASRDGSLERASSPDGSTAVEETASSSRNGPSGDLAARVEDGTVTGADVRTAEAGEGRASTPEIDDVDLSMDDLESTREGRGSGTAAGDLSADAGPAAEPTDPYEGDTEPDRSDDAPGLFGRLKRILFR